MSVFIGWFIVISMSMVWLAILVAEFGWKAAALFLGGFSIVISSFLLFFIGLELINGGPL
tara:strand:- start:113 stop:292 length:180 start_codon:yes stop_codon:yes gene_type:complete